MTAYTSIVYEKSAGIATLILNRPECLNALTTGAFAEIGAVLGDFRQDPNVRVLVLTGQGPGFCSGSDIRDQEKRFGWGVDQHLERLRRINREVVLALRQAGKPSIAAINGYAVGGGLSLALACDLRLASDQAKLGLPFVRLGLIPDLGATFFLPRLIGTSQSCRLLFTGEIIDAEEALRLGLVDRVVPADSLERAAAELACQIASAPTLAVSLARQAIYQGISSGLEEELETEALLQSRCLTSPDHYQGVRAYLEKQGDRKQDKKP